MPSPPGLSPRALGLIVAAALAAVFAGVIWYAIGSAPAPSGGGGDAFGDEDEIPTLEELEEGASMLVTIADRDDPSRVAGTLEADQFEPIGGGKRRLERPEAWIYARSGRAVRVTARTGVLLMPDPNEAPESGTLEGDVTIRVYESTGAPGVPAAPDADPALVARFDEPVSFERRYLRLRSKGPFTITSERADFEGADLTVMLNDLKNRVELIEVVRGDRLVLREAADDPVAHRAPVPRGARIVPAAWQAGTGPGDATRAPRHRPRRILHPTTDRSRRRRTTPSCARRFASSSSGRGRSNPTRSTSGPTRWGAGCPRGRSGMCASRRGRTTSPRAIRRCARIGDGGGADGDPDPDPGDRRPAPAPQVEGPQVEGPQNESPEVEGPDERAGDAGGEVVITWDGPLVVRPMDEDPDGTLAQDELVLEVARESGVAFATGAQGVRGSAPRLRYHATRAVLGMHSAGESGAGVELVADGAGTLNARDLVADLSRGSIEIGSRGSMRTRETPRAEISWARGASFGIVLGDDGALTDRLERASFDGSVLGTRADARVESDTLDARFSETALARGSLRSVELTHGSIESDDGSLTGDSVRLGLAPDPSGEGVTPTTLRARGAVLARSSEGRVETEALDAVLERDGSGSIGVRRATASGPTRYLGADDTTATGRTLTVDPRSDTIVIAGEDASAGQGGSTIFGSEIRINTRRRSVRVDGAGRFEHDIVTEGRPTGGHLRVAWEKSMRFDDAIGVITCEGAVEAISTPDALTRDTLSAARVEIELSPRPASSPVRVGPMPEDDGLPDRALLMARAFGRAADGGGAEPASVESRSYDPESPERASSVLYLEGPRIVADNERQILRVPDAGTLLVMDRTQRAEAPDDPGGVGVGSTGPGLTRMTWDGSLELDRASGDARIRRGVTVRHKSLETARVSDLACDELDARFTPIGATRAGGGVELVELTARGSVRFMDADRTLLADRAVYDAVDETLFASALGDNLVTLRDASEPAPVSAETLLWDLVEDEIEIDAPSPVRAPAGP